MSIQPFHLLRVLLLLFIFTQFPLSSRCCNEDERNALLSFKYSLSVNPEYRLSSWQVGGNCCNWYGIQCSNDSGSLHVTTLNLHNTERENYYLQKNKKVFTRDMIRNPLYIDFEYVEPETALIGTISSSLFSLTHLEYLDLSFNHFHSKIPHQLGNLKKLTYLNLSFNDFYDSDIPHQFANLSKLTHLDLSHSMFSGSITTQFANLSSLQYLDVSSNDLHASTEWLRGLVNIKVLNLGGVQLSWSSSTIKNWAEPISYLADLRELDLSYCHISSFPITEFLNLSRLSSFKMSNNEYLESSPFPIQLANLTSLSVLDLSDCSLQGDIPYLPQLKELEVSYNPDLIVDLNRMFERQWPKLRTLSIRTLEKCRSNTSRENCRRNASYCSIRGSLPTSISNISQLRYLDLSNNEIVGHLPSSISNLSQLEYLYLDGNNITGYIPSSISNLKNLKVLSLIHNNLQGSIPESLICEMSSLQLLRLTGNGLIGAIPSCTKLPNLPNFEMKYLILSSCNLEGYIPSSICNSALLDTLDLSNNHLKGAIPSCLFEIQTLVSLDMSQNHLQGHLPQSLQLNLKIFNLSNNNLQGLLPLPPKIISVFDLSQNNFTGEIAIETGKRFSSARYVSLSGNKLSGSIPSSLCTLGRHPPEFFYDTDQFLDLSNNQLTGTIPSSLGYCTHLYSLHLGMNNLIGNVPNELGQANNLRYLLLNDNALNGTFPSSISQLEHLEIINLQNNNFVSTIPTFIGSLVSLQILSLRSNKFYGSIPKEIMYLKRLRILDLSWNNFSGLIPRNIGNLSLLNGRFEACCEVGSNDIYDINEVLQIVIKGNTVNFKHLYGYNSAIDLSCNNLEGNIPEEIDLFQRLAMLNLSYNHFSGKIPTNVGNMTALESLDLSFNQLSGEIPQSLTLIDNLGKLNLSHNNLSGRIPGARHFETLSIDGSAYIGNPLLCGVPTNKPCESDPTPSGSTDVPSSTLPIDDDQDDDAMWKWVFYGVVVLGYGVGFWGLFFVLLLRREKWWFGYWRVVDNVATRILGYVSK